jgi:hypothetical protein
MNGSVPRDSENDRELRRAGGVRRTILSTSATSPIDRAAHVPDRDSSVILISQMADFVTHFNRSSEANGPPGVGGAARADRLTERARNQPSN